MTTMGCANCGHPLSAHYPPPAGCTKSMWGGVCAQGCRLFTPPKKSPKKAPETT